jgi:hypothetical protein
MNAAVLVDLLLGLLDRAAAIGGLLTKAKAEGRDVTSAELDALFAEDATAKAALQAAIDKASIATLDGAGGPGEEAPVKK